MLVAGHQNLVGNKVAAVERPRMYRMYARMHVAEYFDIQHADSQALAGLGHMNQLAFQHQAVCGVGRQPQRDPGLQRLGKLGRAHMIGVIVGDKDGIDAIKANFRPQRARITKEVRFDTLRINATNGHAGVVVLGQRQAHGG